MRNIFKRLPIIGATALMSCIICASAASAAPVHTVQSIPDGAPRVEVQMLDAQTDQAPDAAAPDAEAPDADATGPADAAAPDDADAEESHGIMDGYMSFINGSVLVPLIVVAAMALIYLFLAKSDWAYKFRKSHSRKKKAQGKKDSGSN